MWSTRYSQAERSPQTTLPSKSKANTPRNSRSASTTKRSGQEATPPSTSKAKGPQGWGWPRSTAPSPRWRKAPTTSGGAAHQIRNILTRDKDDDLTAGSKIILPGTSETLRSAGLAVMSNLNLPDSRLIHEEDILMFMTEDQKEEAKDISNRLESWQTTGSTTGGSAPPAQRLRHIFPETWLWTTADTGPDGAASVPVTAPDSITTWDLRAVGLSKTHGLSLSEASLQVFQPFFIKLDLPLAAVRHEELEIRADLYNYLDSTQTFQVELAANQAFTILGENWKTLTVPPREVHPAAFQVRLNRQGEVPIRVNAHTQTLSDAVLRHLTVRPQGAPRDKVHNLLLSPGDNVNIPAELPPNTTEDSARTQVTLTGAILGQTIDGMEDLLRMPYGCGEQNMALLAPNIFIARYIQQAGLHRPAAMEKARRLTTTGYQRQLIYQRHSGSFSTFGNKDDEGSIWLTAFVIRTLSQARDLVYVSPDVINSATRWTGRHQRADGSFNQTGFVHHTGLKGGPEAHTALTAYVTSALLYSSESERTEQTGRAARFLEDRLPEIQDTYTLALTAHALALAESPYALPAVEKLLPIAVTTPSGTYWTKNNTGDSTGEYPQHEPALETTGYALLALVEAGGPQHAETARATARWLSAQRNPQGGFGSTTQENVVAIQALTAFLASQNEAHRERDMSITITSGDWTRTARITNENFDTVQVVDVPPGPGPLGISADGRGEAIVQVVTRYNVTREDSREDSQKDSALRLTTRYDAKETRAGERITVTAEVEYRPDDTTPSGMVVLELSLPTGFLPARETVEALLLKHPEIKRQDTGLQGVVLYLDELRPQQRLHLEFQATALHPTRAQPALSRVYLYYEPNQSAEALGPAVTVQPSSGTE